MKVYKKCQKRKNPRKAQRRSVPNVGLTSPAHRNGHWGLIAPNPDQFPDARKRYDALTRLAEPE